ncbi:hypothetical protein SG34_009925 [Thalassomonas viridans]|uniref:Uncharacterized protein n=1 Tax=Thalassomonas viridans TaxID=137584 RepID=A0AAE9Z709_9GAMM|nr:hypothetical protein [Thalassomonas viridans]WDE07174.1 hypothetical protein SG34_009925 [Thalassomonas viridans]
MIDKVASILVWWIQGLAEGLISFGFKAAISVGEIDCYGSMHCFFACGERRFMSPWRGEEGVGAAEKQTGTISNIYGFFILCHRVKRV